MQPDGNALGELAALAAGGELRLDIKTTPVKDGIPIANQVANGRSGGIKHVLHL